MSESRVTYRNAGTFCASVSMTDAEARILALPLTDAGATDVQVVVIHQDDPIRLSPGEEIIIEAMERMQRQLDALATQIAELLRELRADGNGERG